MISGKIANFPFFFRRDALKEHFGKEPNTVPLLGKFRQKFGKIWPKSSQILLNLAAFGKQLKKWQHFQRLLNKKRAVISNQKKSTGRKLFDDCLEGGARALQINNGKIQKGFNADLISLPNTNNELDGLEDDKILDYWIFASRENDVQKLWNKGKCLVENGKHFNFDDIQSNYRKTIKNLQEKL